MVPVSMAGPQNSYIWRCQNPHGIVLVNDGEKELNILYGTCRSTKLMSERMASTIIECDGSMVIKLYSIGVSKEMVQEEMRLTNMARDWGIRAPQIIELVESDGRWGFSYRKLHGPTYLDLMTEEGCDFEGLGRSLALLHRELYQRSYAGMPSLKDRLRATIAGAAGREDLRTRAMDALSGLPDGDRLCHGDFHPGNVIVTGEGDFVLDWIDASSGHRLADVAKTILLIQVWLPNQLRSMGIEVLPEDIEKLHRSYLAHSLISPDEERTLQRWMFPVAVARLCQSIPGEEDKLMELIEGLSRRSSSLTE